MSANAISAAPPAAKWAASAATADGATGPSNGQPKAAAIDTVTGTDDSRGQGDDLVQFGDRVCHRFALVSHVEGLGSNHHTVDSVDAACQRTLGALEIQHQAGVFDPGPAVDLVENLLGVGHLRDPLGADKAAHLDSGKAAFR